MAASASGHLSVFMCLSAVVPPPVPFRPWVSGRPSLIFFFLLPISVELCNECRKEVRLGQGEGHSPRVHPDWLGAFHWEQPDVSISVWTTRPLKPLWEISASLMAVLA